VPDRSRALWVLGSNEGDVAAAHRWLPQKKEVYGLRANTQAIFFRRRQQPRVDPQPWSAPSR
jgi:hypothetical protein